MGAQLWAVGDGCRLIGRLPDRVGLYALGVISASVSGPSTGRWRLLRPMLSSIREGCHKPIEQVQIDCVVAFGHLGFHPLKLDFSGGNAAA